MSTKTHDDSRTVEEQAQELLELFRGSVLDSTTAVQSLAALVVLRWADYQDAEQEAMAAFDGTAFKSVLPVRLQWRYWHDLPTPKLTQVFDNEFPAMLQRLKNARGHSVGTHLYSIAPHIESLAHLPNNLLPELVRWFVEQPFETPSERRRMLDIIDLQLARVPDGRDSAITSTMAMAKLVAAIADPQPGERVYDPCFGSARFLTESWLRIQKNALEKFSRGAAFGLEVFGVEQNASAYLIGLARLILAGVPHPHLELGDSLERDAVVNRQREGFDLVLVNPPFNSRMWRSAGSYSHFPIHTHESVGLFVQHAISQLRFNGRAVIIVPEGFLFRSGPEERVREYLLNRHRVEAVVALSEGIGAAAGGIRTSLLLIRKQGPTRQVRMVDSGSFLENEKSPLLTEKQDLLIEQVAKAVHGGDSPAVWEVQSEVLAAAGFDLTPRRRTEGSLQEILQSLRSRAEIVRVADCCEVITGQPVSSRDVITQPVDEHSIPYVQAKDIQKGAASKVSGWLKPVANSVIEAKRRLRAGDVLFSRSGSVSKVGVVRNGAVGGVAAVGLYILRPDIQRLDPDFLLAYLQSPHCQNWLKSQSRGATTQIFHSELLRNLPVPLPTVSLQQRAARLFKESQTDILRFLADIADIEHDPLDVWIAEALNQLPPTSSAIANPLHFSPLERLSESLRALRNQLAHGQIDLYLGVWVVSLSDCLVKLEGIGGIPKGPGLLSMLRDVLRKLELAGQVIKGDMLVDSQARALNDLLEKWIDRAIKELLQDVKVVITPGIGELATGVEAEIPLRIDNVGSMPLREVEITTNPDWGSEKRSYLGEGQNLSFALRGSSPKSTGVFVIQLLWTARSLDGKVVTGRQQLSIQVSERPVQLVDQTDLGGSPYVCGDPISPSRGDVFFGREPLLDQIARQIVSSGNVVLLEGNRRAGKTSILHHLEGTARVPGWLGIYCSLQGAEGDARMTGVPTAEVFRAIASSIAKAMHQLKMDVPLPNGATLLASKPAFGLAKAVREGIGAGSPFSDFREYLEIVLKLLEARRLGLFLMLDEFDKLQEGIENGVTSPQVPENIRFLVQSYPRFSAVLTGSKRLKRFREEYWSALYGLGTRFGVSSLPLDAARLLVTQPVRGKLTYSEEAVSRVVSLTAAQPYLLQCLCNRIFDLASQRKIRSITLDLVEEASRLFVKENEHFASLWDYAGSDRCRLVLAICAKKRASSNAITFGLLHEELTQNGIEAGDELLISDLEHLRELEVMDFNGETAEDYYQLTIPLMGPWIEQHQDYETVRSRAQMEWENRHG